MLRAIHWWNRLGTRLAALAAGVTLAVIGLLAYFAVQTQEAYFVEEVVRGAKLLSHTANGSIHHSMLTDEREEAYRAMEGIGRSPGIDSVRMFNREGRVTFSTERSEVGTVADKHAPACIGCHTGDPQPISNKLTRILHGPDGTRTLGMVTPIYNEHGCSTAACHAHPPSQRVLGVLDLELSLAEIDASSHELRNRTLLLSAFAILLLGAVVWAAGRIYVVRPVKDLIAGADAVADSDFDREIPVRSHDEFGLLSRAFNHMISSLRSARAQNQALLATLERQVEERTAALRQAQEQLIQSEKLSSLGKLSASIAHEINNPLMGILTTAKLLVRTFDAEATPAVRESYLRQLKLVQRETERCSAIVRNLLDFARQRPLTVKKVDVNTAIEESLMVAQNQMTIQQITVHKDLALVPEVQADLGQLRQAILNIVINACEVMPKGGKLEVRTHFDDRAQRVVVEVADNGPGIAPEHLKRIFDPFFTTKEKGTGLGLSVVYGIVRRHGGDVEVESAPGKGTLMRLSLPLTGPTEQPAPAAPEKSSAA